MTVKEVIDICDKTKPNQYDKEVKIKWLLTLESRIKNELFLTHDNEGKEFTDLDNFGEDTELFVGLPYDDIYTLYVGSLIDFHNAEYGRYNNTVDLFNSKFKDFANHYNSTVMPLSEKLKY